MYNSMLVRHGLTTDLGDLNEYMTPVKNELRAACDSNKCGGYMYRYVSGEGASKCSQRTKAVRKYVKKGTVDCPECGCILKWKQHKMLR